MRLCADMQMKKKCFLRVVFCKKICYNKGEKKKTVRDRNEIYTRFRFAFGKKIA